MFKGALNLLRVVDLFLDCLSTSITSNQGILKALLEAGKVLISIDHLVQLGRKYYKAIVEMGWRLVGSLLSLLPLPEGLCAVGFAVQGVFLNPPHELPPVSAEEGV